MSTIQNLWGELPLAEAIRTPASILQEQANQLTELTKGILEGEVTKGKSQLTTRKNKPFIVRFNIIAPALDNYRYAVMRVYHDIVLYPLAVVDQVNGLEYECEDEDNFINVVAQILSSTAVHKAIAALLSQSKSD